MTFNCSFGSNSKSTSLFSLVINVNLLAPVVILVSLILASYPIPLSLGHVIIPFVISIMSLNGS